MLPCSCSGGASGSSKLGGVLHHAFAHHRQRTRLDTVPLAQGRGYWTLRPVLPLLLSLCSPARVVGELLAVVNPGGVP